MERILFGDEQANYTGLIEFQKMDNAKWKTLEDYMRSNGEMLQTIQQQNTTHYEMTLLQEERLKKIEIVFNTFGRLSKVKKKTLAIIGGFVSLLTSAAYFKEQIADGVARLFGK